MPVTGWHRLLAKLIPTGAQFFPAAQFADTIHFIQQTSECASPSAHSTHHPTHHPCLTTHHAATRHANRVNFIDVGNARPVFTRQFTRLADEADHLKHVHTPKHSAEARA